MPRSLYSLVALLIWANIFAVSCKPRSDVQTTSSPQKTAARRKTPPSVPGLKALAEIPVTVDPVSPQCANPPNAIVAENCLPGQPPSVWDVPANDPANNGFTMKYSYAPGETVDFKMRSTRGVTLKIFRMGYYRGLGGRLIATIATTPAGPLTQPDCSMGLPARFVRCDNWSTSAQWAIPASQVSGVYMARMEFADGTAGSLIPFLIRNENRAADILLQTSDANWQAYNWFGGISTYEREGFVPPPPGEPGMTPRASYLRPLAADASLPGSSRNWHFNFFGDHFPAIRWFEKQGYNVNYIACKDTANPLKLPYLKAHKVFVIGDISRVPDGVRKVIQETTRYLAENTGLTLTLAVSYGGRAELVRATREIAAMAAEGSISLDQIDASLIEKNLYTAGLPEVDLVIRTSGELRVSNFLLWQIAYAELYFSPVFWPDFTTAVYADALIDYLRRRRRFGLTDDQIPSEPVTGLSPRISQELPPC